MYSDSLGFYRIDLEIKQNLNNLKQNKFTCLKREASDGLPNDFGGINFNEFKMHSLIMWCECNTITLMHSAVCTVSHATKIETPESLIMNR